MSKKSQFQFAPKDLKMKIKQKMVPNSDSKFLSRAVLRARSVFILSTSNLKMEVLDINPNMSNSSERLMDLIFVNIVGFPYTHTKRGIFKEPPGVNRNSYYMAIVACMKEGGQDIWLRQPDFYQQSVMANCSLLAAHCHLHERRWTGYMATAAGFPQQAAMENCNYLG